MTDPTHALSSSADPSSTSRPRIASRRAGLALEVLPGRFGICRLRPDAPPPMWAFESTFTSVSRSGQELSVVCDQDVIPDHVRAERGWRALRVLGPLDFSLVGVLAAIATPLAEHKVSMFAVSTFDTDYILVRDKNLEQAIVALEEAGHRFDAEPLPAPKRPKKKAEGEPKRRKRRRRRREDDGEAGEARKSEESEARPKGPERRRRRREDDGEAGEARKSEESEARPKGPERRRRRKPERSAAPSEDERPRRERDVETERPEREARAETRRTETMERPAGREPDRDEGDGAETPPKRRRRRRRRPRSVESERTEERIAKDEGDRDEETPRDDVAAPVERVAPPAIEDREPPVIDSDEDEDPRAEGLFTGAIPQHDVETTDDSFDALGLSKLILDRITEVGFAHPTPIQRAVIPDALAGSDVIGLAETGSGKTAAFVLPMAERLTHGRGVRGLILCPTREIAMQTKAFLDTVGHGHALDTACIIGGVKIGPQMKHLRGLPDILVATPGRMLDHLERGTADLGEIEMLVLDEADHMLDLGFLPQIQSILEQLPSERQTMMFSATMPPPIERLAGQFMRQPTRHDFLPAGRAARGIEHRLYLVREERKLDCLLALLSEVPGTTLVFTRRKVDAEWLSRQLEQNDLEVTRIHSDRSQGQRVKALRGFREGAHRVLVATDVAARGIDIPRLEHVVNFGFPDIVEDYIHRAGRTARGSAAGIVSSIGTWQDKITIRDIEAVLGFSLPRKTAPGVEPYIELKPRKTIRRRLL
ncbi:MAG: DEAD/DEAH box helicase [Acidobacteriota bacterium]